MDNFIPLFTHIISIEGITFVDSKNDRGGASKFGLSTRFLEDFYGRIVPKSEVRQLTVTQAQIIYRTAFYDTLSLKMFPIAMATTIFDQAVHSGVRSAVVSLQQVLGVHIDGVIGPITINAALTTNQKQLLWKYIQNRQDNYCRIVKADPSQLEWLKGWLNRLDNLIEKFLL